MTTEDFVIDYVENGSLNVRVYNALKNQGLLTVDEILRFRHEHRGFRSVKNTGKKSWAALEAGLAKFEAEQSKSESHSAIAQVATMES
jgi:DNA-directed RNA polymerase alpha subunit